MTWPWSRETKANPASRLIVLGLNIQGVDEVRHPDFAKIAQNSYGRNSTVYACVNVLARNGASVPWVLLEFGRSGAKAKRHLTWSGMKSARARAQEPHKYPHLAKALAATEVTDHPLLRLVERPNPSQPQSDFLEQLFSYWLLSGNAYQKFITTTVGGSLPQEMWNFRPDRVTIKPARVGEIDTVGMVGAYHYQVNSDPKTGEDHDPQSVIHYKFFHPTDDWYGMSPVQAIMRDLDINNMLEDWNFALLKQGARPPGALVAPTNVDQDNYERMRQDLQESYAGPAGAGRPLLLSGGLKWEQLGLGPAELDWLAGLEATDVRICRGYHVPPETVGDATSKNYNSYPEARAALYHEGVMPLLDRFRDMMNARIVPLYGDRFHLDYDRDQIEAIQEDRTRVWSRLNASRFLSTNEKRMAAGYDTVNDELADVPEFLVNPTPGATGIIPATVKRMERDPETKLVTRIVEEPAEESVAALLETKARQLTLEQRRARAKLRTLFAKHYKSMGKDLAAHLRRELNKL